MRTGSNIRLRKDGRYEARYEKGRDTEGHIIYGYAYGLTYEEAEAKRSEMVSRKNTVRQMNLLILGAGDHGHEVKELAEELRIFREIAFLDDDPEKEGILGPCSDLRQYLEKYPVAIAAVGDSETRKRWINELVSAGFILPTLIHSSAVVASNVEIGPGTVICSGSTLSQRVKVGTGCIIDSGAVIERGAAVPDWTYVECGSRYYRNSDN